MRASILDRKIMLRALRTSAMCPDSAQRIRFTPAVLKVNRCVAKMWRNDSFCAAKGLTSAMLNGSSE